MSFDSTNGDSFRFGNFSSEQQSSSPHCESHFLSTGLSLATKFTMCMCACVLFFIWAEKWKKPDHHVPSNVQRSITHFNKNKCQMLRVLFLYRLHVYVETIRLSLFHPYYSTHAPYSIPTLSFVQLFAFALSNVRIIMCGDVQIHNWLIAFSLSDIRLTEPDSLCCGNMS